MQARRRPCGSSWSRADRAARDRARRLIYWRRLQELGRRAHRLYRSATGLVGLFAPVRESGWRRGRSGAVPARLGSPVEHYVAFLRGINLGNRRIKSPELVKHFEAMGSSRWRPSGPAATSSSPTRGDSEAKLQKRSKPSSTSGSATTSPSSCAASRRSPRSPPRALRCQGDQQIEGQAAGRLLAKKPTAAAKKKASPSPAPTTRWPSSGRELHWLPSTGLSETEVDLKAIDKALGKGTMRTAGTIEQIAAKYCG